MPSPAPQDTRPPEASSPTPAASAASHVRSRIGAVLGLLGAVFVMVLSLSAFVVGSNRQLSSGSSVGQQAIAFSLRDAHDQRVSLQQFRGQMVVLLFGVETGQLPRLPVSATVLAVEAAPLPQIASEALQAQLGVPVQSLVDPHHGLAEQYNVRSTPEAVVIDAEGIILDRGPAAETLARLARATAETATPLATVR